MTQRQLVRKSARQQQAEKEKGFGTQSEAFQVNLRSLLLQRSRDVAELVAERGAQAVDRGDDGDADAGRDQSVFDRGGARLVLRETSKKVLHLSNSINTRVAVELGREFCAEYIRRTRPAATVKFDTCSAVNRTVQFPLESIDQ